MAQARIFWKGGHDDMNIVIAVGELEQSLKDYIPPGWAFTAPYVVGMESTSVGIHYPSKKIFCSGESYYPNDYEWQHRMLVLMQIGKANINPYENSTNEDVKRYLQDHGFPKQPQLVLPAIKELYAADCAAVGYVAKLREDLERRGFNPTENVSTQKVREVLESIINSQAIKYFEILRSHDLLQTDLAYEIIGKVGIENVWG